jgi:hypothetical protein
MNFETFITLVSAVVASGGFTAIVSYYVNKRKTNIEASEIAVDISIKMVETMDNRLKKNEERLVKLEKENSDLRMQIDILLTKNAYITDLEFTKYELEAHVNELTGRVSLLEHAIRNIFKFVKESDLSSTPYDFQKLQNDLSEIELQLGLK